MSNEIIKWQARGEKVAPDQILTDAEVKARELDEVMQGCPGYEHLEEREEPNWPPKKVPFSRLRETLNNLRFRLKYPHAHQAFQNLIDEKENRVE